MLVRLMSSSLMTAVQSNRAKSRQATEEAADGDGCLEIQREAMSFLSHQAALQSKYSPSPTDIYDSVEWCRSDIHMVSLIENAWHKSS